MECAPSQPINREMHVTNSRGEIIDDDKITNILVMNNTVSTTFPIFLENGHVFFHSSKSKPLDDESVADQKSMSLNACYWIIIALHIKTLIPTFVSHSYCHQRTW